MEEVAHILEQNGFIRMSDEKRRISLNKGYKKKRALRIRFITFILDTQEIMMNFISGTI